MVKAGDVLEELPPDPLTLFLGGDVVSMGDVVVPRGRATVLTEVGGQVIVRGRHHVEGGGQKHVYLLDVGSDIEVSAGFSARRPVEALDQFRLLKDEDGICKFAERYGLLGLCPHGFAEGHGPGCTQELGTWAVESLDEPPPLHGPSLRRALTGIREPLSGWWSYIKVVKGLMTIAADLKSDSVPEEIAVQAWEDVVEQDVSHPYVRVPGLAVLQYPSPQRLQSDRAAARLTFAEVLNRLLDDARVTPALEWEPDAEQPRVTMQAKLLGQIAQQIVLAAAGAHGLAYCGGCAVLFLRSRSVQRDRRAFCDRCRADKVPAKLRRRRADRKRRARSGKAATSG